jgi:multidrug resistance efflux pump
MRENLKNKIIVALGVATIAFFITSISSYQEVINQRILINQERRARIELEEKAAGSDMKISQLREELERVEANSAKSIIDYNQRISELKLQLETVTKLKEKLEEDLGQALVSPGKR